MTEQLQALEPPTQKLKTASKSIKNISKKLCTLGTTWYNMHILAIVLLNPSKFQLSTIVHRFFLSWVLAKAPH